MPQPIDPSSYRSPDPQRPAVPLPIEREARSHDPYAAFRFGDFRLFTAGNLLSITGRLMLGVAGGVGDFYSDPFSQHARDASPASRNAWETFALHACYLLGPVHPTITTPLSEMISTLS